MKGSFLQRALERYAVPLMPGYRAKGHLFYVAPVEYVLRGFWFDSSAWDKSTTYLYVFVQALYVPKDSVRFGFGRRIGTYRIGSHTEATVMPEVVQAMQKHVRFVEMARTPAELARHGAKLSDQGVDDHCREAVAYSHILAGNLAQAERDLTGLVRSLTVDVRRYPESAWLAEIQDRCRRVLTALATSPSAAICLLDEWRTLSMVSLGLATPAASHAAQSDAGDG